MKKFLSLAMVLTMLLSVFCCLPAEAAVYDGYPYVYCDFEDSANYLSNIDGGGAKSWKAGGAAGSNGCLSLTESGSWSNIQYHLPTPLKVGETYRISAWVRLTNLTDLMGTNPKIVMIFYTTSAAGNSAYKMLSLNGSPKADGEWVLCTGTMTWDGTAYDEKAKTNAAINPNAANKACFRIGDGGNTLWMNLAKEDKMGTDFKLQYDFDDLIVEPVIGNSDVTYDDSYVFAADFEDGTTSGVKSVGGTTFSAAVDAEHGKVLNCVTKAGAFNEVIAPSTLKFGHLYKVSVWIKRTDDLCSKDGKDSTISMPAWLPGRLDKENVVKGQSWPTVTDFPVNMKQNEWCYFEKYIKYDVKTFDGNGYDIGFRVGCKGFDGELGKEGMTYLIDNFFIQDMGIVQNGDFEAASQSYIKCDAGGMKSVTPAVFGWYDNGATSALSTDVRSTADDETTTSTKSMAVTVNNDGGVVFQSIRFDNDKTYSISFWAKGADLAEGETKTIKMMFDRKVNTVDGQDVYEVPDSETVFEGTLTNKWTKYTCEFEAAYEPKSTPAEGVIPRTPFLYFDVDGNKAGTKFLIDDITFVDKDKASQEAEVDPHPRAESASISGDSVAGGTLDISYTFVSEAEKMEGQSVLRALISEDGKNYATLGQYVTDWESASYTVPDVAIGKYLKLELAPMDETNQMGQLVTFDMGVIKKAFEIIPKITDWSESTGAVNGSVKIACNLSSFGEQNVVVILALYDENNTLVGMSVKPITVSNGYDDTVTVSASLSGTNAASAKMFVWSGKSLQDAGEKSYSEAVSYVNE